MSGPRPYRVESRSLARLEEGLAVFVQERTPAADRPGLPGPLSWLGVAAMGLSLILLTFPAGERTQAGTLPLILMILWGAASLFRMGVWLKRHNEWRRAWAEGTWGWFAVRFEERSGRVRLIGPVPHDAIGSAVGPETAALPLSRVEMKEWMSPNHPWSDCVEPEDYIALNLAFRVDVDGPAPDWEGSFDLLDGVEPDHRWYVTAENPEAVRRRRLARGLLGLPLSGSEE